MNAKTLIRSFVTICLLVCLALAAACSSAPKPVVVGPENALVRVHPDEWPILTDDMDSASLVLACDSALGYLNKVPPERLFNFGGVHFTAAELIQSLERQKDMLVRYPDPVDRTQALKQEFDLYRSRGSDGFGRVLFTGYYEPMLEARHQPDATFDQPIYGLPDNLLTIDLQDFSDMLPDKRLVCMVDGKKVVPYYDREDIDFDKDLEGKAPVLGYVDEMVEAFFLQIQGSGQLEFEDGTRLRVGYAAANGHPYRSIGRLLLDEGLMEPGQMSMQGILKFLDDNPQHLRRVLSHNPSYVFFRPLDTEGGPLGCYGQPVNGGRAIATDRRYFTAPAMAYIETETPTLAGPERPVSRFVVNLDTGGAIRGAGRVDLFFGTGDEAGELAGRMKYEGRLYFLLPKEGSR